MNFKKYALNNSKFTTNCCSEMSNQALHIAAEVLIIGGIAVYFNKQAVAFNAKLDEAMTQIKSLQESNEKLNKHVNSLYELIESMGEAADPFPKKTQKRAEPVQVIRKRNPGIVKRQMPLDDDYSLDFEPEKTPRQTRNDFFREPRASSQFVNQTRQTERPSEDLRSRSEAQGAIRTGRSAFETSASVFNIPMQMMMSMSSAPTPVEHSPKVEIVENDEDDELKEELAMLNSPVDHGSNLETCPVDVLHPRISDLDVKREIKTEIIDI
jgi:hypothetical protein